MRDLKSQAVSWYGGMLIVHIVLISDGRQSLLAGPVFGDISASQICFDI